MTETEPAAASAPRMEGGSADILENLPLHRARRGGRNGVVISIRLASYRSLPLSCLRGLQLAIDGRAYDSDQLTLVLDGGAHRLAELTQRTDLWWYILDSAELFVAPEAALTAGEHTVELSMTTIMPFATGGRSTRTDHCRRHLSLTDDDA